MIERLLADLDEALDRVRSAPGRQEASYRFGARVLTVHAHDVTAIVPDGALVPVTTALDAPPDPGIVLEAIGPDDAARIRVPAGAVLGPYGGVLASGGERWIVLSNPDTGRLLALERERRVALYAPGRPVPPRDLAELCRPLLHWLAILDGGVVVHAGGVASDGQGLLVAGTGNAGKTTLTRLCLDAGLSYLGDNVVEAVRSGDGSTLVGAYPSMKVRPGGDVARPEGWPAPTWDPEPAKDIYLLGDSPQFESAPVAHAATLVLDAAGPPQPRALTPAEAFFRIAPNTIAQFPFFAETTLRRIREVTAQVPVFVAGRMPAARIPEIVRELIGA